MLKIIVMATPKILFVAPFKTIPNTLWALNIADNKFDTKAALINIIKDIC